MSTENEGAAVPPEAESPTAPPASGTAPAPESGAQTPGARTPHGPARDARPEKDAAEGPPAAAPATSKTPPSPTRGASASGTPTPPGTPTTSRTAPTPATAPPPPDFAPTVTAAEAGVGASDRSGVPGGTRSGAQGASQGGADGGAPGASDGGSAPLAHGDRQQPPTQERNPYAAQGGYAAQSGYPAQGGHISQGGYAAQSGYTAQFGAVGHGGPPDGVGTGGGAADGGAWGAAQPPPYGGFGGGDVWGAPAQPGAPGPKRGGGLVAAVLVAALVAGGIGGGIGFWAASRDDTGSTTVSASGNPEALNRKPTSVAGIAQKALPSVVTIEAQGVSGEGGTGTGFVYDKQGHILTNNHVVATAAEGGRLSATFSNGKKYDAEVVGRAQGYDVAVIKLKNPSGATLTPLPLGKSADVAVGDATIAIGAPFGLSGTVTTGIISAKDRPVASSDGAGTNASYMSALQTDASINPGNSGGPLLDAGGNVIGINSAIQSAGGGGGGFGGESQQSGSIGLGFAIPIDQAKRVADDLIKSGVPIYPQIGVQVSMRDTGDGATIARTGNNGTDSVTRNGPADKAGLKPGDTITKLDDTLIDSGPTLISEIWQHRPGDQVTLTYTRGGKEYTAKVTLGQRKGDK